MPRYSFSATDIHGNVIEGAVDAADINGAASQIGRMGYNPVRVELGEGEQLPSHLVPNVPAPAQNLTTGYIEPDMVQTYARPLDLSQVFVEAPVAVSSLSSLPPSSTPLAVPTLNAFVEQAQYAPPVVAEAGRRLEPWERSVGLGTTDATETKNLIPTGATPGGLEPIESGMGASALSVNGAKSATVVGTPVGEKTNPISDHGRMAAIPYRVGYEPEKSLGTRFKERILYPISSGVVLKDLAPFLRQFATLINAGLPLFQALVALESNTKNSKLKEIARESQRQVQAGGRLSDAWAAYPWIFSPMQVAMVRSAEQGGMLEDTLRHLADYIEHDLEVKRTINQQTLYPKLVIFCALMILGRSGFTGGMPAVSQLVLGSMGKSVYTMTNYFWDTIGFGLLIGVPLMGGVIAYRLFFYNVPEVRDRVDTLKISIPVLGRVSQYLATARFARTYAALYRSGFTASTALPIAGDASGNSVIRSAARSAVPVVERGGLVSDQLAQHNVFPSMSIDMLRTGETSGSMDKLMDKVADYHEAEGKSKAFRFAMIFGVGVFLLVAIVVAFSIISQWSQVGSASTNLPTE